MQHDPAPVTIAPPAAEDLKQEASIVVDAAKRLELVDRGSHERAQHVLKGIAGAERRINERLDPIIATAYSTHKALTSMRAELRRPFEEARRIVTSKLADYEAEERRKAEAEARRLQEEAKKREEDRQLVEAIEAEEHGGREAGDAILQEQREVPTVVVQPQVAKVDGVVVQRRWRAEVTDKAALVQYVAQHPEWLGMLDVNMPLLNKLAIAQREQMKVPGVKAIAEEVRSVRAS